MISARIFKNKELIPINIREIDAPLCLLRKTRDCDTSINKAIKNQEKFKSDLSEIVRRK